MYMFYVFRFGVIGLSNYLLFEGKKISFIIQPTLIECLLCARQVLCWTLELQRCYCLYHIHHHHRNGDVSADDNKDERKDC